ncbi:MAG: ankyrin repeat domain-containing protein [Polyangia bacterium]
MMLDGPGIAKIPLLILAVLHATTVRASGDSGVPSSALHLAVRAGNASTVRQRLEAGDAPEALDENGMTALHVAAIAGQVEAASVLLDHGADPNALAPGAMTPLHFAAMLAHPELAGLLLRHGARTDIRNASGMMPLHLAANDKVVDVLAEAGADVNGLTTKGQTPLHTARNGLVARALVSHKTDPRIRNSRGRTAMQIAGIETLESAGLSIHSVMLGRLRGMIGQMPVTITNVSSAPIRNLSLTAHSPACTIDVTPPTADALLPGQNADLVLTMIRNPTLAEGEHPVYLSIRGDGKILGATDLKVDTSSRVTPEDRGMIRLAKGTVRPATSRWYILAYATAPSLAVAVWLLFRRRSRA